jgi:putative iron-regulated protein
VVFTVLYQLQKLLPIGVLLVYGLLTACSDTSSSVSTASSSVNTNAGSPGAKDLDRQILVDFVDKVIIPNNELFAQRATALSSAIAAFSQAPSDTTLKAAQQSWVDARTAWEQTECFTFGPAGSLGYDGALDTWPVNEVDVKAMLKSNDSLSADSIDKLKDTEKGFHVIEYFLYGQGQNRKVADLKPKDLEYLKLLGENFETVAKDLSASWSKGLDGKPAYREVFTTAGAEGNATYPTLQAGFEEMVQGMVDSLDEVANEKLGETFEKKDPKLAESRFSLKTLADMQSNLQGAENVYLGQFPDANTKGLGLSAYIAQVNPALDSKIKAEIEEAEVALSKIPDPFEKAILDPKAADSIKTAQAQLNEVRELMEKDVKPLLTQKS